MDEVTVCNMAMGHIGADNIEDLNNDRSVQAEACKTFFNTARDATLEAHNWGFARVPRSLALSSDENLRRDWAYMYEYPAGVVATRRLLHVDRRTNQPHPFEVALKPDGENRCILTDLSNPVMICTQRTVNMNLWTPLAIMAFSWKLAALTVNPIMRQIEAVEPFERQFMMQISKAEAADANQGRDDKPNESELVEARR